MLLKFRTFKLSTSQASASRKSLQGTVFLTPPLELEDQKEEFICTQIESSFILDNSTLVMTYSDAQHMGGKRKVAVMSPPTTNTCMFQKDLNTLAENWF